MNVGYEIASPRPYIRSLMDRALFVPGTQTFELTQGQSGLIAKLSDDSRHSSCHDNTLMLPDPSKPEEGGRYVFCFSHTGTYSLLYDLKNPGISASDIKHYPHILIFKDHPDVWSSNETLRLIFNYQKDSVVFMTDKQLHIFQYSHFVVKTAELSYAPSKTPPTVLPNCIDDPNCVPPSLAPIIVTEPDTSDASFPVVSEGSNSTLESNSTTVKRDELPLGFWEKISSQFSSTFEKAKAWQLVLFILLLLAIILSVCWLTRRRDQGTDAPITAKFYQGNSYDSSLRSEKWRTQSLTKRLKPSDRSKRYKQPKVPTRLDQPPSALRRNLFSSLFTNSSQAAAQESPSQTPSFDSEVDKPARPEKTKTKSKQPNKTENQTLNYLRQMISQALSKKSKKAKAEAAKPSAQPSMDNPSAQSSMANSSVQPSSVMDSKTAPSGSSISTEGKNDIAVTVNIRRPNHR